MKSATFLLIKVLNSSRKPTTAYCFSASPEYGHQRQFNNGFSRMVNQRLKNDDLTLSQTDDSKKSHKIITVPYHSIVNRDKAIYFFQKHNIKGQILIFNVDSSHAIGMKRYVSLCYLKTKMVHNQPKPEEQIVDILTKQNPQQQIDPRQIILNDGIFFASEPLLTQELSRLDQTGQASLLKEYYMLNINRGIQRLFHQYKVPVQYLHLMEQAYNSNNTIVFGGLNQFMVRKAICYFYRLADLKDLFMIGIKTFQPLPSNNIYSLIFSQKMNHKQMNSLALSRKYWELINSQMCEVLQNASIYRLRSLQRVFPNPWVLGYQNATDLLASIDTSKQKPINIDLKVSKDRENELQRVQKNALLEVMLNSSIKSMEQLQIEQTLFGQPYTNQRFPYIEESMQLKEEDLRGLKEIFFKHLKVYACIKEKALNKHS